MTETCIDKLFRSRRRTIGLEVTRDSELVVRAPLGISLQDIQKILFKKASWITKKKTLVKQRRVINQPKEFVSGEIFYYLGKPCRLKLIDTDTIRFTDYLEFPKIRLLDARGHLIQWYKNRAHEKIKERVDWYSKKIGLTYSIVKISNAKRRLGSCSARGNLNFSWRLVMAPLEVIDYVAVHELIHLLVKNHSRNFWNKVKLVIPEYRERRKWLKNNSQLLDL
ncbi:MAG: SprT family zinc-dependent metalloprotease [Candidatus Omnitrophota bacterium]